MYYSELKSVLNCLQNRLGRPISGIWQPDRNMLIIGLSQSEYLLVVPRGPLSRIHTIPKRPTNPTTPFSFQGACRAHLGGRLNSIQLHPVDREIVIGFDQGELIIRMVGRNGGIWLRKDSTIIASLQGPAPEQLDPLPNRPVFDDSPRFSPDESEDWNAAAFRWYSSRTKAASRGDRTRVIRKKIEQELKKKTRLIRNLMDDLGTSDDAERFRQIGDILGIHLHSIKSGASSVDLPNPYLGNQITEIKLNPSKSAPENMNWYYKKSRRLERAGTRILEAIESTEKQVSELSETLHSLEDCPLADLKKLEDRFTLTSRTEGARPTSKYWNTWTGPLGEVIYIGKNEAGNRKLISQKGRGDDIWMHIRQRPGPHVLIPMKRGKTPSLEVLLIGGQIAVLHAKLAPGEVVDVQYAQIRHIRPVPGDQLGRVTVQKEKVLQIERSLTTLNHWSRD